MNKKEAIVGQRVRVVEGVSRAGIWGRSDLIGKIGTLVEPAKYIQGASITIESSQGILLVAIPWTNLEVVEY